MFGKSLRELKSVKAITICGIMAALAIILSYVATIRIGSYIRVGFSFLPNMVVDFLFGPVVGGLFGGILDIVKYFLNPTGAFFPGFTISAILGAMIYGLFLYGKKVTLARCLIPQIIVKAVINCGLNTLWLKILYGQAIAVLLPSRIVSNLCMLPIDVAIMYAALKLVQKSVVPMLRADKMASAVNK